MDNPSISRHSEAQAGITLSQLQGLGGNAGWYGTNPTAQLNFEVTLLDDENHTVNGATGSVAFDTGAENAARNRAQPQR